MTERIEKEKQRLKKQLMEELDRRQGLTDEEIGRRIEEAVLKRSRSCYFSLAEKQQLKKELFHAFRGLDVLSGLLEDKEISEIMINGAEHIFIEKNGALEKRREQSGDMSS
ncbi:MAG: hypothetical protein NC300_09235 [Bacteroidales bacterium]|nr:hypothetical protein [Clostridium sp.]MCM1204313.1 hypothetical protein [Bacteroidales bacterium]